MCKPISVVVLKNGDVLGFVSNDDHSHTSILDKNNITDDAGSNFSMRPFTRIEMSPRTCGAFSASPTSAWRTVNPATWVFRHDDGGTGSQEAPRWWSNRHEHNLFAAIRQWQATGKPFTRYSSATATAQIKANSAAVSAAAKADAKRRKQLYTFFRELSSEMDNFNITCGTDSYDGDGQFVYGTGTDIITKSITKDLKNLRKHLSGVQKVVNKASKLLV